MFLAPCLKRPTGIGGETDHKIKQHMKPDLLSYVSLPVTFSGNVFGSRIGLQLDHRTLHSHQQTLVRVITGHVSQRDISTEDKKIPFALFDARGQTHTHTSILQKRGMFDAAK